MVAFGEKCPVLDVFVSLPTKHKHETPARELAVYPFSEGCNRSTLRYFPCLRCGLVPNLQQQNLRLGLKEAVFLINQVLAKRPDRVAFIGMGFHGRDFAESVMNARVSLNLTGEPCTHQDPVRPLTLPALPGDLGSYLAGESPSV